MEKYIFVPNESSLTFEEAIRINVQIALENHYRIKVKTIEVLDDESKPLSPVVIKVLKDIPRMEPNVSILTNKELDYPGVNVVNAKLIEQGDVFIVLGTNILSNPKLLKDALATTASYILSKQTTNYNPEMLVNNRLEILTSYKTEDHQQIFLRLIEEDPKPSTVISISSNTDSFPWLKPLQNALKLKKKCYPFSPKSTN